jgi:GT2 family glycosyltransferase
MFAEPVAADRPPVSVIVCTKGRADLLPDCVSSVAAGLRETDQIVIVEAQSDAAGGALRSLNKPRPAIRHLHLERPGKSRQLNRGIEAATGDLLLFTDDDVRVPPSWADDMARCFIDGVVGVACGRVQGLTIAPGWDRPHPVDAGNAPIETWTYAHGASMAVRATAAWEVGGFDERLGPGAPAHGEEHDLLLRIRRRGWRVVIAPGAPVHHLDWRSEQENRRNALVYERGGGALVGAAVRRDRTEGLDLLRRRLRYQRNLIAADRGFGVRGLMSFAGGFQYGLRLAERDWLQSHHAKRADVG